jgi:hypothetical protein
VTASDAARRFLRAHWIGVLATHSQRGTGHPFGSVVPFVCDANAQPVFLASALAEHAKNLERDGRAGLVVHDMTVAETSGARLSIIGDAARCADPAAAARYLRCFPDASALLALGDFSFWRIVPREALFVQGFGRIAWIDGPALRPPPSDLAAIESSAVAHMNADHRDAIARWCAARGVDATDAAIAGVDGDGFDLRARETLQRFEFDAPVTTAAELRRALAGLAQRARDA